MKIGRNDLCFCGSGKKYKKCCLKSKEKTPLKSIHLPRRFPDEMWEHLQRKQQQTNQFNQKYGEIRPLITVNFQNTQFVAVGNELHYSKDWKTFPDFLFDYIRTVLGRDWGQGELAKPLEERHQILQWYDKVCRFQQEQTMNQDGMYEAVPNGITYSYLLLAYDLYILRHHNALQNEVIRRLKIPDQFQGARHELFVAATCIRAGYDISYEDESDGSKKHPEFVAVHKGTGQKIAVEAKSRHRPGILGRQGERNDAETSAGITQLLNKAIQKPTSYPYVIFIDLNLPPSPSPVQNEPWFQEIVKSVSRAGSKSASEPDPFNLIVFTNHTFYYKEDNAPSPRKKSFFVLSKRPRIPAQHIEALTAITLADDQYGKIPNDLEEGLIDTSSNG